VTLLDARFLKRFFIDETPSGSVNSANVTFTLSQTPLENDAVDLWVNGLKQIYTTHYTISGVTITMVAAPDTGSDIRAKYVQRTGGS